MVALSMVAIFAFACENGDPVQDPNRLATPEFTANVQLNSVIITWNPVAGAAYYEIVINDNAEETIRTDINTHLIENLMWGEQYTISLTAISANPEEKKNSEAYTATITIPERVVPAYREWFSVPATAISNNGRWTVGGYDRQGMIIDLLTDEMTQVADFELYDIADNGVAVGSSHRNNPDGSAAYYIDGEAYEVDLGALPSNLYCSCLTAITPDGEYAVGWFYDYDDTYYTRLYGTIVPFTYNLTTERVTVPAINDAMPYAHQLSAIALKGVTPERELLGYEQSVGIFSIFWSDEQTPFEYVHFEYESDYTPVECLGDTQNLMSQSGRYIFGKGSKFAGNSYTEYPAVYDRQTNTMMWFEGGSVTAMGDNGIAFINDAPYYMGTTSYIVDTNDNLEVQTPIVDWLKIYHNLDLENYIPDGIIVIGVSADNNTIIGIVNTDSGWITCAISLNGTQE